MTLGTAVLQTGSNNNRTEPADGHTIDKTVGHWYLRGSETLFLRAEVRTANTNLDSVDTDIGKHILDIEQAVIDGGLPQNMLFGSNILCELINNGEILLHEYKEKGHGLG